MSALPSQPLFVLAALLADPWWSATSPGVAAVAMAATDDPALPAFLRRNRVSLVAAQRAGVADVDALLERAPLAALLAHEDEVYQRVRREYSMVRAAFAGRGIKDVLIKSAGVAPSFPHMSDNVDDLVPAALVGEARAALRGLGYVELRNLEEPRKFFFKRFSAGQEAAAHHLHELVGWAASFMDEEMVLQRAHAAADDADVLVPHSEDALLITMAHAFYENKAIKLGDLGKVRHLLRTGELDWPRLRTLAANKGWLDGLDVLVAIFSRLDTAVYGATLFAADVVAQAQQALSSGQRAYIARLFDQPLRLPLPIGFGFSKRMFYAKCLHDRQRSAGGKVYDIVRHTLNGAKLKLRVHSQQGMLVTLSGVDGAGKTRHAQALVNALERCDIRTSYVWSRSGSSALTDWFVRIGKVLLRRPAAPAATQEQRAAGRKTMLRNPVVRTAWSALVTLDLLWQYMVRVRLPLLVGRVVVCDRYTYDALADVAAVTGSSGGVWPRLLVLLSPRPSRLVGGGGSPLTLPSPRGGEGWGEGVRASFVLTVAPDTAATRRSEDELSAPALQAQTALYLDLARRHGLVVLDNNRPFADVNDEMVRTVIRSYYTRYHTLINALFMANPHKSSE